MHLGSIKFADIRLTKLPSLDTVLHNYKFSFSCLEMNIAIR